MIAKIRQTKQGTEYWDNVKKVTLFVPKGSEPSFEVTKDVKSLLHQEPPEESGGIDLDAMTIAQLQQFATDNGIALPGGRLRKDYVLELISKALTEHKDDDANEGAGATGNNDHQHEDNPDGDKDQDTDDGKPDAE